MELAFDAIRGQRSAHSFATGPVIADPFISPLLFTITPALSSKYMNTPSRLRNGLRCRITTAGITYSETRIELRRIPSRIVCSALFTFFLNSGLPFFTVATNISPTPAAGNLFKRPRMPWTAMTYRFLAPWE